MNDNPRNRAGSGARPDRDQRSTRMFAAWWSRLLDGQFSWGSLDISPRHHGVRRFRLVMFPPGITAAERRQLRLWRAWRTWGPMLWLVLEICLSSTLTPWTAIAMSTTVYLSTGLVTAARTGDLRSQVRTLRVVLIDHYHDERAAARYAELKMVVGILSNADTMRAQGRFTAIDHELAWWRAYDRLDPTIRQPSKNRRRTNGFSSG